MPLTLDQLKSHADNFLMQTEEARAASEKARDYVDHKQWSAEQIEKLRSRKQAPIVVNRIKPKVQGLKGLLIQRKTDPKAYPRTQEHEDSANAITDALRFVADNVDFDETKLDVADDFFVEGYGGAIVDIKQAGDDVEIQVTRVPWDRIYYDPHSRRADFSDATYMGVYLWMYLEEAERQFDVKLTESAQDTSETETFDDRPKWAEGTNKRRRVRVAQEYYLDNDVWHVAIFTGETFLLEPRPSPMLDEEGEPTNPIELVAAHIDRENRRFGEVHYWMDLQDEINARRSKALHLNSVRQTAARRGAVGTDIDAFKREFAKPDGHVEYEGEKGDFEVLPTGDMAQAQLLLLEQATNEIDAVGFNAQLAGERQGNLSGKAILALQGAGSNELADLFNRLNGWEKRIYRQVWTRIRQFWGREKWIRVTDDERNLRWAGFNVPMTVQQILEEKVNDESIDEMTRKQAAEVFMEMMQAQDPRLQEVVEVRNEVAQLDVDIILEQSLDTINVQQEQFEMVANLASQRPEIALVDVLRLSTLRDKDELIKKIEEREQNQAALADAAAQAEAQKVQIQVAGEIEKDQALTEHELKKDLVLNQQKIDAQRDLKAIELAFENERAGLTRELTELQGGISRDSRQVVEIPDAGRLADAMNALAASQDRDADEISDLAKALGQPRQVERNEDGQIVGIT